MNNIQRVKNIKLTKRQKEQIDTMVRANTDLLTMCKVLDLPYSPIAKYLSSK